MITIIYKYKESVSLTLNKIELHHHYLLHVLKILLAGCCVKKYIVVY